MQNLTKSISSLYKQWKGVEPVSIDLLPQSGSERRYFRLHGKDESVIGAYGANIPENETFIYFSNQFKKKTLAVPEILAVSDDKMFYLQEDFGKVSLLNHLEKDGFTDDVYDTIFDASLSQDFTGINVDSTFVVDQLAVSVGLYNQASFFLKYYYTKNNIQQIKYDTIPASCPDTSRIEVLY